MNKNKNKKRKEKENWQNIQPGVTTKTCKV